MKEIIDEIINQQKIIAEILGYYDLPNCRGPITHYNLGEVKNKMRVLGCVMPNSYIGFLKICDGIENLSCSFGLFGSKEFLSNSFLTELDDTLKSGIGYEFDPSLSPLLIGSSNEVRTKVFFDYKHERSIEDEPVVFEGEPGFLTLHYSFYDFLECRISANKITIRKLSGSLGGSNK